MSAFALLSPVDHFVIVRSLADKTIIDNIVLKLHCIITSVVLITSLIIVKANNLIGNEENRPSEADMPGYGSNMFCWKTFTMPENQNKSIGTQVAHPVLGANVGEKEYDSYYQWVPLMLIVHCILFSVPYLMWKWLEGSFKVQEIFKCMRKALKIKDEQERNKEVSKYVKDIFRFRYSYLNRFRLCVYFHLLLVAASICFICKFLAGPYLTFGINVAKFSYMSQEQRNDPMIQGITKYTFYELGPSGTTEKHDAICILADNILKEKIYIVQWFWFIILAVLCCLASLFNIALISLPMRMREFFLDVCFETNGSICLDGSDCKSQLETFLVIQSMRRNLDETQFKEVLSAGNPNIPNELEITMVNCRNRDG